MVKQRIAVLLVLGMLPWASVNAQQKTILRVSATVEEFCDVTAPDLAAGDYTAQRRASPRATTLLRATCTPNTTYNVSLNRGTLTGADTLTGVGTGRAVDHSVFDGVPATQIIPLGDYAEPITVRVYY